MAGHGPGWEKVKKCVDHIEGDPARAAAVDEPYAVCRAAVQGLEAEFESQLGRTKLGDTQKTAFREFVSGLKKDESIASETLRPFYVFSPLRGSFTAEGLNRFWKELISAGQFAHPQDRSKKLLITPERMDEWIRNFKAGVLDIVPVTYSHPRDNVELIENAHGRIVELQRRGNSLFGLLELDDEATGKIKLGLIASDSVGVAERYDNQGRRIGEVLEHVALTNDPYVTGLAEFAIAAEAKGREVILMESFPQSGASGAGDQLPPRPQQQQMPFTPQSQMKPKANFSALKFSDLMAAHRAFAAMGNDEGAKDAEDEMMRRFGARYPQQQYPGHTVAGQAFAYENDEKRQEDKKMDGKIDELKAEHVKANAKLVELEARKTALEAEVSELRSRALESDRRELAGRIEGWRKAKFGLTPALAEKLEPLIFEARRTKLAFSCERDGKTSQSDVAATLCEALDTLTSHGLVDNRHLGRAVTEPLAGPHSGGESTDINDSVNAYCEQKGVAKFAFEGGTIKVSGLTAEQSMDEARRYEQIVTEMLGSRSRQ